MPAEPDHRLRLPELVAYREAAARRRAAAFCDAPDYVLGIVVQPLTPRTFSMLAAVGCHFVCGGRPTEGDVRNWIWFHSPAWTNRQGAGWQRRKAAALRPFLRQLDAHPLLRRLTRRPLDLAHYHAVMALAIADIRRLVEDAFADCPAGGPDVAPVATMEAQLTNTFAKAYGWAPERTRATPLRQLFQLVRCIQQANGHDIADRGEQEIVAAHLRRRQAELDSENAQREESVHG